MQVYVQKSTRTTLPRNSSVVSGGEFSQPVAPENCASRPSLRKSTPNLLKSMANPQRVWAGGCACSRGSKSARPDHDALSQSPGVLVNTAAHMAGNFRTPGYCGYPVAAVLGCRDAVLGCREPP